MIRRNGWFTKTLMVILFAGVAVVVLSLIPLSPLKQSVQVKLSETLGRNVTVDSVRLNLIGSPHLVLTGVTAHEDPAFGDGVFLKANEVRAGVDVIQYLRSRLIVIDSIVFKSAQVNLVKNRDGVWSWSTLGKPSSEASTASSLMFQPVSYSTILTPQTRFPAGASTLREVKFENASVKLRDNGGSEPSELFYRNLVLNAWLTPQKGADSGHSTQARGNLVMRSEEDGEADRFKATLPFDIKIDDRGPSMLSVSGSIGPGPIETGNLTIGEFSISGELNSNKDAPLTGKGQLSLTDLNIQTANLSERVARALKVDQIGDMSPGTAVTDLVTDFQISEGTVHTTGLRIQQLDGLGDATAQNGEFKIDAALIVNYAATVVLSPEATSRVKSMSTALGLVVTILETNNRLSVPINVSGDVRNPEVQVDVSRIF
jgi:hypothetical protein